MNKLLRVRPRWLSLWAVLATLAACDGADKVRVASGLSPVSLARAAAANTALSADGNQLATDMRAGAFALYQAVANSGTNFVMSPLALQLALGMTYLASSGETASELAAAMRWTQAPDAFGVAQQNLLDLIGGALATDDASAAILQTATRAFVTDKFTILPALQTALGRIYQAPVAALDFFADPDGSRERINAWVGEQTAGKIGELLPSRSVDPQTVLVLTAALRFKAGWAKSLSPEDGASLDFTTAVGQHRQLSGLSTTQSLSYRDTEAETTVRLDYAGGPFAMLLVRPKGDLSTYLERLTATTLDTLVTEAQTSDIQVALTLPAFDIASSAGDLVAALEGLGVKRIFMPTGELVVLDPAQTPPPAHQYLGHVFETAHISLDKEGTEAEAAAAVVIKGTGATAQEAPPRDPVPVVFNKPFLFFLKDTLTQSVIFMGHVADPSLP